MNTNREELEEQLEEIQFQLMMNQYAEEEGQAVWDEFAAAEARGEVPEFPAELDQKCQDLIAKHRFRNRGRLFTKQFKLWGTRVALIGFACLVTSAIMISSVDAFRVPVMNFLLAQHEKYMEIRSGEHDAPPESNRPNVEGMSQEGPLAGLIPEEYQLVEYIESENEQTPGFSASYATSSGAYISLDVLPASKTVHVDTEDAEYVEETSVLDYDALFVIKNGYFLRWVIPYDNLEYRLRSSDLDQDAFWKLAEVLAQLDF